MINLMFTEISTILIYRYSKIADETNRLITQNKHVHRIGPSILYEYQVRINLEQIKTELRVNRILYPHKGRRICSYIRKGIWYRRCGKTRCNISTKDKLCFCAFPIPILLWPTIFDKISLKIEKVVTQISDKQLLRNIESALTLKNNSLFNVSVLLELYGYRKPQTSLDIFVT